jgi:glycosyltransferase involved in cell wall biosynthesis
VLEVELLKLYSQAGLFVLPSYHEGLPIVLLEAMSYEVPVLASDIPANKEVDLPQDRYFRCGGVEGLKRKLESFLEKGFSQAEKAAMQDQLAAKYNWNKIDGVVKSPISALRCIPRHCDVR